MVDLGELDLRNRSDHQLSDSVTTVERDLVIAMIDQQHSDLAPISAVDQSGGVDQPDPVTGGVSRTGKHQTGEAFGDGDGQSGGDGGTLAGSERHVLGGDEVEARVTGVGLARRR